MTSKLNINKIESYSQALAERICTDLFATKKSISGADILNLTAIGQVNFFVLKNLFDKWTEEQYKLRSPYFNYDNEEVKQALAVVANKLSNNILVEKEFLKPLLVKAVAESLHWIIFPLNFIEAQHSLGLLPNVARLKENAKYFKINKFVIDKAIQHFENQNLSTLTPPLVSTIFEQVIEQNKHQLSDVTEWLEKFGNILSFDLSDLVASIQKNNVEEELPEIIEPLGTIENIAAIPAVVAAIPVEEMEIVPVRTVLPPLPDEGRLYGNSSQILNDQFAKNNTSLNDMLKQHQSKATVNEQLAHTKIHDLRSAIALNKRFQIINELFKGNTGEYLFAIEDIENSVSHTDAIQILQEKFAHKYNWTFEDDLLKEFLQLIERRFL